CTTATTSPSPAPHTPPSRRTPNESPHPHPDRERQQDRRDSCAHGRLPPRRRHHRTHVAERKHPRGVDVRAPGHRRRTHRLLPREQLGQRRVRGIHPPLQKGTAMNNPYGHYRRHNTTTAEQPRALTPDAITDSHVLSARLKANALGWFGRFDAPT